MELIDLKNWTLSDDKNLKASELESIIRQMAVIPAQIEAMEKQEDRENVGSKITLLSETYAAALLKLNSKNFSPFLSGKYEFEKRLHLLPYQIGNDLKNARLQLVDKHIYTVRVIEPASNGYAAYSELMSNSDVARAGVCNINNRKLEEYQYFLLTGISLVELFMYKNMEVSHRQLRLSDTIASGEFQLTIGSKIILPKTSGQVFRKGMYKLDNPKILPPQTDIKPEIWFNKISKPMAIRTVLHGVILEKN